jgi:hypothetical protein
MFKKLFNNNIGQKVEIFTVRTYLVDTSWLLLNENSRKVIYAFKTSGDFYLSKDGDAEKGKWDFISDSESIVLELDGKMTLYNMRVIKDYFLYLQKDNSHDFFLFANWTKYTKHDRNQILSDYKNVVDGFVLYKDNYFLSDNADKTKYAFALYELRNTIRFNGDINRIRQIIDSLTKDRQSGINLLNSFREKFGVGLVTLIDNSEMKQKDKLFTCEALVRCGLAGRY